jgi:NAD(P)-dependent dehydrogenase (short-subunit alcohol dehydrogenase family)
LGELAGKTALVTGATSGIGRAIAERFAAAGAALLLTGRNQASGSALAAALGARFVAGDIAEPAVPDRLVAEALAAFGRLDILVNNAGITHRGSVLETSDEAWDRVIAVNLTAAMRCARAALRAMVPAGTGSIVNIASDFGVVAGRGEAAYCASKGALVQLTRAMAVDHGPQGIRVNAVCPGDVETPMLLEGIRSGGEAIAAGRRDRRRHADGGADRRDTDAPERRHGDRRRGERPSGPAGWTVAALCRGARHRRTQGSGSPPAAARADRGDGPSQRRHRP